MPLPSCSSAVLAALLALALARVDWTGVTMRCGVRLPLGSPPADAVPAFTPPDAAALAASTLRTAAVHLAGAIVGPESFAFGPDGTLYTGSANGTVWAVRAGVARPLAHTGGRPVGLAWDPTHARLLVACSVKGLLAVEQAAGRLTVRLLASHAVAGVRGAPGGLVFLANSVAPLAPGQGGAGPAGGALFTSSMDTAPPPPAVPGAWWQPAAAATTALLSGLPTGRLLRFDEATGVTTAVAGGLWFANGVALHPDGRSALVAETFGGRLVRVGLTGEGEGVVSTFARLPGFPDGVEMDGGGGDDEKGGGGPSLWVAIVEAPPRGLARALARSRALRWLVSQLPPALVAGGAPPLGLVVRVSAVDGRILETRADAGGKVVRGVTHAVAGPDVVTGGGGRRLYLGSLGGEGVVSVAL